MSEFTFPVLCIDHGLKVLGFAISRTGFFAEPLRVIYRKSKKEDFAQINTIIQREKIQSILLGLPPIPPDFVGYSQADRVRSWAAHLAETVNIPIFWWDEGLSSVDATQLLAETDQYLERVDAHAAAVILQSCLDALREGHSSPEMFVPPQKS